MPAGKLRGGDGIARKQIEELTEPFGVPSEVWRKLPENRPQLFAQAKNAGRKEIGERRLDIAQFFHVRDKSRTLHAKEESSRRFREPALITRGALQGIKRAVDLDGIKGAAGELQLEAMRQFLWIKDTPPGRIGPA